MNDANRDLLVLDTSRLNPQELERQLQVLNAILFHIENWEAFSIAHEIIDVNRRRFFRDPFSIRKISTTKKNKPFVFTCNKN